MSLPSRGPRAGAAGALPARLDGRLAPEAAGVFGSTSRRRGVARGFARELVDGVRAERERIDELIAASAGELAPAASLARRPQPLAARHLRAAGARDRVPTASVIDEAIEIARRFGSEDSAAFVERRARPDRRRLGARERRDTAEMSPGGERTDPHAVRPPDRRGEWQRAGSESGLRHRPDPAKPKYLRARHVPLPVGRGAARRPPRGLHRDRHRRALQAHARASTCCTRWAGTPSACRRSTTRSRPASTRAIIDARRTSTTSSASSSASASPTTGTRDRHHRPGLLPLDAVDLPEALRARPRLPGRGAGQLVPGARHRARERGGHGRQVRRDAATPSSGADEAVDAAHHGLRRAPARGPRRPRLARARQGDAARLDRPLARAPRSHFQRRGAGDEPIIRVFTTRPDTLFGATFMVLAPEHPLVATITTPDQRGGGRGLRRRRARSKSDRERTDARQGEDRRLHRRVRRQPGRTAQRIPIWIADYVLAGYGTGAIMAVPGHDERDYEFATQVRPADRQVVAPRRTADADATRPASTGRRRRRRTRAASTACRSPRQEGRSIAWLEEHGHRPSRRCSYKLRDWLFSRQRYWGEPFPILHLADGARRAGARRRAAGRLPSSTTSSRPATASRRSRAPTDWVHTHRSRRRRRRRARETNTMPQWAGSCWYYLRFLDPQNDASARRPGEGEATGCPSTSTSAAPSTRCCTCSTRASGTRCSSTPASSRRRSRSRSSSTRA